MNCAVSILNYDTMAMDLWTRPHAGRTTAIEMSFVKINLTAFQAAAETPPRAAKTAPRIELDGIISIRMQSARWTMCHNGVRVQHVC